MLIYKVKFLQNTNGQIIADIIQYLPNIKIVDLSSKQTLHLDCKINSKIFTNFSNNLKYIEKVEELLVNGIYY